MRARRRTQKDGRGLEGALEGGEGSKARSKGGRVRKHTTLDGREKVVEKYKEIFFCGLILVGSLSKLKFLKCEKFSKAISNLAISRWPSIWWISLEISLVKFAKLILQCLKVWMICMHLYLIWNIGPHFSLIFLLLDWWELTTSNLGHRRHLASSPLELAHVSLFPDLFTQLRFHGAYRDPLAC